MNTREGIEQLLEARKYVLEAQKYLFTDEYTRRLEVVSTELKAITRMLNREHNTIREEL